MILSALRLLGVFPIVAICIYRVVTLALNTQSWLLLLRPDGRPGFLTLLRLRWIGESVNNLLPVAQVGGDLARASLITALGVPRAEAGATMMADFAVGVLTQIIFGLTGAIALLHLRPATPGARGIWGNVIAELALATLGVAAVSLVFHLGVARLAAPLLKNPRTRAALGKLAGGLKRLDLALKALIARQRALASAFVWHLLGWLSQVGETWLLLTLFGAPVPFRVALVIESLSTAARGAAFFIPSGIGVQEVTLVSMCRLVGVDMEAALALGIAKRAREVVLGGPGLVAWLIDQRRSRRRRQTDG